MIFSFLNNISFYSFLLIKRSGPWFCLYFLSTMLPTKRLGNYLPLASWHKQGTRSWIIFRSSCFILQLDAWNFHGKIPTDSFWSQICGPLRPFISYYAAISIKILKIYQCKLQVNCDCKKTVYSKNFLHLMDTLRWQWFPLRGFHCTVKLYEHHTVWALCLDMSSHARKPYQSSCIVPGDSRTWQCWWVWGAPHGSLLHPFHLV